jgi:hypothetical protein
MNKDITPRNNKEQKHGLWEVYWSNGYLAYKCFYHNGKLVGYNEHHQYYHTYCKLRERKYNI